MLQLPTVYKYKCRKSNVYLYFYHYFMYKQSKMTVDIHLQIVFLIEAARKIR